MTYAHILGPPRGGRKVETEEEFYAKLNAGEIEIGGNVTEGVESKINPPIVSPSGIEADIQERSGGWRLSPISLRGGFYTYYLWNEFLEKGKENTLGDWEIQSRNSESVGNAVACSGDVLFSIADFLYQHINSSLEAKHAWEFLAKALSRQAGNEQPPVLLSKCVYQITPGIDQVIHDIGLKTQFTEIGQLWGPEDYLDSFNQMKEFCLLTMGCRDPKRADKVFSELMGERPYVARVSELLGYTEVKHFSIGIPNLQNMPPLKIFRIDTSGSNNGPAIGVKQVERLEAPR